MTVRELIEKLQELGPVKQECTVVVYLDLGSSDAEYDAIDVKYDGYHLVEIEVA